MLGNKFLFLRTSDIKSLSGKGYKFQKKSSYLFTGTETKQSAEIVKTILLRMPYNAETAQN